MAGERVVIVPNHVSFLDGPLIAAFLPGYPLLIKGVSVATRDLVLAGVHTVFAGQHVRAVKPLFADDGADAAQ